MPLAADRRGRPAQRVAAAAAISGTVAGEGAYALIRLAHALQGWVEIAVAALAAAVSAIWLGREPGSRAAAVPVVLITAAATYAAYSAV